MELPDYGVIGDLAPEIRQSLASRGKFETLNSGHAVITQGQPHGSFSVVLSGKLRVSVHAHGDLVVLAEFKPGEIVGEMCVIDPQNASADVVVSDRAADLWTIEDKEFNRLVEEDPAKGFEVMKVLARALCRRLRHNSDSMLRREETVRDHYRDNDY
ncbi:cyclic nucleotide-binding domain-containing protein [soil metagenome]